MECTSLSHKQIRNNINNLKNFNNFHNLIKGGGKGKGGQFWFHYSIIPYISIRKRRRVNKENQTTLKVRKLSELFYNKTTWDYFGCVLPNSDLDIYKLVYSLSDFISFYVIHRKNEVNHIHFSLKSHLQVDSIKNTLRGYFELNGISIDKVFLTRYNKDFGQDTLNYLLRRGRHSFKNDLIDWGLTPINSTVLKSSTLIQ